MYSGYGIAFDREVLCSFHNDFARNVVIFAVDPSPHSNNHKNNRLILGEGPTSGINGSFRSLEKSLVLISVMQTQNL